MQMCNNNTNFVQMKPTIIQDYQEPISKNQNIVLPPKFMNVVEDDFKRKVNYF